jgi:hypothetical protein
MRHILKLSEVLSGKESSFRYIRKHDEKGFGLVPEITQYLDGIKALVKPYAETLGIDPADVEVRRTERAFEKAEIVDKDDADVMQIISTRDMDRDDEILLPKGIVVDEFNKAPQVLLGHNPAQLPVALGPVTAVTAKDVRAATLFGPTAMAQDTKELVKGGFLRTASVGFVPLKIAEKGTPEFGKLAEKFTKVWPEFAEVRDIVRRIIEKWLILEWSFVSVPANINALTAAISKGSLELSDEWIKQLGLDKVNEPKEPRKKEETPPPVEEKRHIQPVHHIKPKPKPEPKHDRFIRPLPSEDEAIEKAIKNTIDIKHRGKV